MSDEYFEPDEPEDEFENAMDDCGQLPDGTCMKAGSEHCGFECPFRDNPVTATGEGDVMSDRDGGPAFATGSPEHGGNEGMSKRDYFAAAALNQASREIWEEHKPEDVAKRCYLIADAMLKAGGHTDE